jgi:hypothetical protein
VGDEEAQGLILLALQVSLKPFPEGTSRSRGLVHFGGRYGKRLSATRAQRIEVFPCRLYNANRVTERVICDSLSALPLAYQSSLHARSIAKAPVLIYQPGTLDRGTLPLSPLQRSSVRRLATEIIVRGAKVESKE